MVPAVDALDANHSVVVETDEQRAGPRQAALERLIVAALALVLLLAVGSVLVTGQLASPAIEATQAVNNFENHLLESHLAFDEDPGRRSDEAVLAPLDAAQRLCATSLADIPMDEDAARPGRHPCDGLPRLRAAAQAGLLRASAIDGSGDHADYDAALNALVGDAEALDAWVASALAHRLSWVRGVQVVTAVLLAGLVLLIAATARAQRRSTDRLTSALRRQATHDALTGVHNRLELRRVLEQAAAEKRLVGVLFLDLDGFRTVNDTAGHAAGDALLVAVAQRLRQLTRPGDTVVRLGGDEFAVVCPDADEATARQVAERLVAGLHMPLLVDNHTIAVSASVGVTSNNGHQTSVADLKRQADIAMYAAKAHGGDRAETYQPQMHAEIVERLELTDDLAAALADGALDVAYQPIVDIASGRVRRLEALARWNHPTRGAIPPDVFIGLAEASGLIDGLGALVLQRACADLRGWQQTFPQAADVDVAVNVSTLQLTAEGLVDTVRASLSATGLAAEHLTIEVTEGALAASHTHAEAVLAQLRALGVRVAVDDFGTGHSSLSRLRELRVQELKVDRSFISPLGRDSAAEPLVVSILALARSLHLEVVAEGVETSAQLQFLTDHGCDLAQGYLLSKPRTAQECTELWSDTAASMPTVPATQPGEDRDATTDTDVLRLLLGHLHDAVDPLNPAVLRTLLAKVADLSDLETAYLTRIDWQRGVQHVVAAHNTAKTLVAEGLEVPWRDTVCHRMLAGGPAATDDVPGVFADSPAARDLQLQTYVGVPVLDSDGDLYGTLCAASGDRRTVGDDTIRLMEVFAALIASHFATSAPGEHGQSVTL